MKKGQKGLEESMEKLEAIVSQLEGGDQSLEESLSKFEEGIKLGKQCREILDKADARIRELIDVDDDGNRIEGDFDDEP